MKVMIFYGVELTNKISNVCINLIGGMGIGWQDISFGSLPQ
jgi:hypothetical protein